MGSGKSTLGKKLANKIGITFYDTDDVLEEKFGKSIAEFFNEFGEKAFREEEKKIIQCIADFNGVIATGGGLPCYDDNMSQLKKNGTVIYLKRPAKELFHRLVNAKAKRPKIKELNSEELMIYIEELLAEREPFYMQADIIVDRENQTVERLLEALK